MWFDYKEICLTECHKDIELLYMMYHVAKNQGGQHHQVWRPCIHIILLCVST